MLHGTNVKINSSNFFQEFFTWGGGVLLIFCFMGSILNAYFKRVGMWCVWVKREGCIGSWWGNRREGITGET